MDKKAQYTEELTKALTKQVERHPERYVLGDKTVADFVKRDVESMATKGSCVAFGPAHRIAARACGIPGTFKSVLNYLGYVKPKTYTLAA
jgi:hypothetical protein